MRVRSAVGRGRRRGLGIKEPTRLAATIIINRSSSRCSACGKNADPVEKFHEMKTMKGLGCGSQFVRVGSDYRNLRNEGFGTDHLPDWCHEMRPDLDLDETLYL